MAIKIAVNMDQGDEGAIEELAGEGTPNAAIQHDLVKVLHLLRETEQYHFRGVEYATKKDATEKLTVTITFPSPSELAQMRAEKAATQGQPAQAPGATPSPAGQPKAAPQKAPAPTPAPAAPGKADVTPMPQAGQEQQAIAASSKKTQVLSELYPASFLKSMGY
jgi:hypothetical protein